MALSAHGSDSGMKDPDKGASPTEHKLIGVWEVAKSVDLPRRATGVVEFTKNGKMKVTVKLKDKTLRAEGTYKVEGDKVMYTLTDPNGKKWTETNKIKTLDDKNLILVDEKSQADEFKRK